MLNFCSANGNIEISKEDSRNKMSTFDTRTYSQGIHASLLHINARMFCFVEYNLLCKIFHAFDIFDLSKIINFFDFQSEPKHIQFVPMVFYMFIRLSLFS